MSKTSASVDDYGWEGETKTESFSFAETCSWGEVPADEAVPSSTKYKNKWALKIFPKWQQQREMKVPLLDSGGLFKDYELHKVNPVGCEIEDMDAMSLNYWLREFVVEVAKDSGKGIHPELCTG